MPGMTRDEVDRLNAFVKAGHIDEARALLKANSSDKAKAALKRLNAKYPPSRVPSNRSKEKAKHVPSAVPSPSKASLIRIGILSSLILVVVFGSMALFRRLPSASPIPTATLFGPTPTLDLNTPMVGTTARGYLAQACQAAFYHQRANLSTQQYEQGCDNEAVRLLRDYPAGTSYCVENDAITVGVFLECLKRRQIGFSFTTLTLGLPTAPIPAAPTIPKAVPLSTRAPYVDTYPNNCSEAIAMGLSESQAGSYSNLDRDGDGKACYGD